MVANLVGIFGGGGGWRGGVSTPLHAMVMVMVIKMSKSKKSLTGWGKCLRAPERSY